MQDSRRLSTLGRPVVVLDAVRTPIGRYRGGLSALRPDDLGALVLQALANRNPSVAPESIDDVAFGAANQSGEDNRNVARMAVLLAGWPVSVPGTTLNRLCGSSLDALLYGFREISLGEADCVVVGGVESMSRAPFVLAKPEAPFPRALDLVDTTLGWRLVNEQMPSEWTVSLGETAENVADLLGIDRAEQDDFALVSHQRALSAQDRGDFAAEIAPVTIGATEIAHDEGPRRDSTREALARLQPVFRADGTVTAGNSSTLNDGASALLLVSEDRAQELGVTPIARILGGAVAGVTPELMGLGPVPATERLLGRFGFGVDQLHAIEINEAFAAQAIGALRQLDIGSGDHRVNAWGGAIALGHPLGASGARIATTLVRRLRASGGGLGLATMCIGVGQGISVLVEV